MAKKTYLIALHGPYTVEYTDLPFGGGSFDLWIPKVGDVLLNIFADSQAAATKFLNGNQLQLNIKHGNYSLAKSTGAEFVPSSLGGNPRLDFVTDSTSGTLNQPYPGYGIVSTGYVFHSNDPVQIYWTPVDATQPLEQGHVELYALIAHPVGE